MFMMNFMSGIIFSILGSILVFAGLVFLLRNFFCWYFKINQRLDLETKILNELKEMNKQSEKNESSNEFAFFDRPSETAKFESEEDLIINIFNGYKNIAVYNISSSDENIFTYFKAKQYNIIPISHKNLQFPDFKTYATLMSVDQRIEILLIKHGTENIENVLNECIARRKIKNDVEYIWFEDIVTNEKILKKFSDANIKVINGQNMYKQYVKLMLKTTLCSN